MSHRDAHIVSGATNLNPSLIRLIERVRTSVICTWVYRPAFHKYLLTLENWNRLTVSAGTIASVVVSEAASDAEFVTARPSAKKRLRTVQYDAYGGMRLISALLAPLTRDASTRVHPSPLFPQLPICR